jgi:hypothetical protein
MMKHAFAILPVLIVGVALGLTRAAEAQTPPETQTNIGLRVGAGYSDNLRRDRTEESSAFGIAGVDVGVIRNMPRTDLRIHGNLDRHFYSSDIVSDEFTGSLNAGLNYVLVPQVLNWSATNNFGQVRRDFLRASGPGNREHLNVFSTGPDLFVPLSHRTRVVMSGRYSDRRYFDSDRLDSHSWYGHVGATRAMSPVDEAGLFGSARRIEHDGEFTAPYDIYSAYGSYSREMAQGSLGVQVGANALDFMDSTQVGILVRGNLRRELTGRSTVSVRARREFQDSSDIFRARQRPPDDQDLDPVDEDQFDDTGELGLTANPLIRTSVAVSYHLRRPRGTLSVGTSLGDEAYQRDSERDRRTLTLTGGMSWELSPIMVARVGADYRLESFRRADVRGHDIRLRASLSRELGQQLDVSFDYLHGQRRSGRGVQFNENRAMIMLRYTPTGW